MNMRNKRNENEFESWARLLISRKVPEGYRHLVNSKVVGRGAAILKLGDAFEVRIYDHRLAGKSPADLVTERLPDKEIIVTPFPRMNEPAPIRRKNLHS